MCVSSNRTLTAKFTVIVVPDPILYVHITDEMLDERGGSLGYLDSGEVEEIVSGGYLTRTYKIYADSYGNAPQWINAKPGSNNQFLGWYDRSGNKISSSTYFYDQDIDAYRQQHIYASFSGQANPDDAPSQVTISLSTNGGHGKIGFSYSNLTSTIQTKTFKYGDKVTIYAEGDELQLDDYNVTYYYCTGFLIDGGGTLKTFSDNARLHSYTFTATRDITVYASWKQYE